MKSTILRVIRREKDGNIWEYSKSLELTKFSFEEEIKEYLTERKNNTQVCLNHGGAFKKGNFNLFRVNYEIDFSSQHLKNTFIKEMMPKQEKLLKSLEQNVIKFLKNIKKQKNYVWFLEKQPEDIYKDNFDLLAHEFEKDFERKYSKQINLTQNSTLDSSNLDNY